MKKPLVRVSREVLIITLYETRREASAYTLPLQGAVVQEIYQVSRDDCFADCIANCCFPFAPFGGYGGQIDGFARLVIVLLSWYCSFHFSNCNREKVEDASTTLETETTGRR